MSQSVLGTKYHDYWVRPRYFKTLVTVLSSLDSWRILEKNKNNKEKIQENHLNDLHHLTHKNKIWQKSSTPPMLFSKVFWNLSLGRTGSAGQIYLNRWWIIIIKKQLHSNSKIGFWLQVLEENNVADDLRKVQNKKRNLSYRCVRWLCVVQQLVCMTFVMSRS
jgi:hypothetical protein